MQLSDTFLKFKDSPLNLREVSLSMSFENSNGLEQISDFNLTTELIKSSPKHAISTVLSSATKASADPWNTKLYIQLQ